MTQQQKINTIKDGELVYVFPFWQGEYIEPHSDAFVATPPAKYEWGDSVAGVKFVNIDLDGATFNTAAARKIAEALLLAAKIAESLPISTRLDE